MFLFYVLSFFKKGDTIQGGHYSRGTLFKEIRYATFSLGCYWNILKTLYFGSLKWLTDLFTEWDYWLWITVYIMVIYVVEFQREGYKIISIFDKDQQTQKKSLYFENRQSTKMSKNAKVWLSKSILMSRTTRIFH